MALREDKEFAISGNEKGSVREETHAVSDTRVMIVQNRHQKPLHPLSHQHQEAEVRREKGALEAEAIWEVQPTVVQRLLERYLLRVVSQLPCSLLRTLGVHLLVGWPDR